LEASSPSRSRLRTPHFIHRLSIALVLAVLITPVTMRATTSAEHWVPPRTVFVPAAGHMVDGLFLDLWRAQPGLLGDPITEEFSPERRWSESPSDAQVVQYFANVALLYVPDAPPEEQVQLLPLGRQALEQALASTPSLALTRAAERSVCGGEVADCLGIAASGHTLRGLFRAYWESAAGPWLGLPLTESFRAADNSVVQYFENGVLRLDHTRTVQPLPLGRSAAKRLQLDTEPIPQPADVPTYDEELFVAESTGWSVGTFGPGPQQGAWKEIVVSISAQAMWAYENGELVNSSYVSTGTAEVPQTVTPIGHWSILTKYEVQDMEGTISDEYYFVADVPDVMYFDNLGNALHGTYWHSNFGAPMSHGCVNLPLDVADWMYNWAPIGTAVSVIA
jgi:hypothetical protein